MVKLSHCSFLNLLRKVLLLFIFLLPVIVNSAEKPAPPDDITGAVSVSAEEVIKLIFSNPDLVIIDSRKKTEYLKGHIEGALNILNTALTEDDLKKHVKNKSSAVLFYCNGIRCMRSADSVNKAIDWGYTNVFWFRGGWTEWLEKRFPVVAGEY